MSRFGMTEIILILFIVILLFGAKRIPEAMKGIADGIKELRKSRDDILKG